MTPHRFLLAAALAGSILAPGSRAEAQSPRDPATLAIAFPRDPASPVPTLWRNNISNREVSDLMFLRLADLGPEITTAGDNATLLWAADADGSMISNLNTANPPTITLTTNGSLALAGVAFWKSITVSVKTGSPVMVKVDGSFSGTPTTVTAMGS